MPSATRRTRCWLFTPGTRLDRFAKAAEIGADVLIIDLEDAVAIIDLEDTVAPDDKPGARKTALDFALYNLAIPVTKTPFFKFILPSADSGTSTPASEGTSEMGRSEYGVCPCRAPQDVPVAGSSHREPGWIALLRQPKLALTSLSST
jgi:hypothetical protein